jgi:hypothetical protein
MPGIPVAAQPTNLSSTPILLGNRAGGGPRLGSAIALAEPASAACLVLERVSRPDQHQGRRERYAREQPDHAAQHERERDPATAKERDASATPTAITLSTRRAAEL